MLVAGILGGGHCLGMCGGFVVAYSVGAPQGANRIAPLLPHLLYHGGRIAVYTGLGGLFGTVGGLTSWGGVRHDVGGVVHLLFGTLLVLYGLSTLGVPGLGRWADQGPSMAFMIRWGGAWLSQVRHTMRPLVFGLLTGLLPCNLHYAMQLKAVATGSASGGMTLLFLFGVGTAVPLLVLGLVAKRLSVRARRWMVWGAGVLIVILGVGELLKGIA